MITGSSLAHRQAWWFVGARREPLRSATHPAAARGTRAEHGLRPTASNPKRSSQSVSTIRRIGRLGRGDLRFVAIAHGQQHVLREVQVAALLAVVLENLRLDDRIDG